MQAEGIYVLIGMPYSGSTILSFLLGSHSRVYNGADLYHLNPDRRGQCSIHKDDCPVWTKQALEKTYQAFNNIDDWYDAIANATGRPYICDASKQLDFYEDALPHCSKELSLILLEKHPMRSAASDIYNRLFAKQLKINQISEIHEYLESNFDDALDFIEKRLDQFVTHYQRREQLVQQLNALGLTAGCSTVKYEAMVQNPAGIIHLLLDTFQLEPEPGQLEYTAFEHHPITGNMGPVWKTREAGNTPRPNKKNFRKGYYLGTRDLIVMDDKYKELFTPRQLSAIEELESYKSLVRDLGYPEKLT